MSCNGALSGPALNETGLLHARLRRDVRREWHYISYDLYQSEFHSFHFKLKLEFSVGTFANTKAGILYWDFPKRGIECLHFALEGGSLFIKQLFSVFCVKSNFESVRYLVSSTLLGCIQFDLVKEAHTQSAYKQVPLRSWSPQVKV